ncbi:MAG: D-lyxose/D-mannose family sugar isomerase [Candidatus Sumerlaeia bacterium]
MKRSEINALIEDSKRFLATHCVHLPPWAFWSPEDWRRAGPEADEIRDNRLGWDLTDFGSGDFSRVGLILFTLRNGNATRRERYPKPYAEKILIVGEGQVTPMHFHWRKMEDIINRGGGNLIMQLYQGDRRTEDFTDQAVTVSVDGVARTVEPGGLVCLRPGQSITLMPYVYHKFWGELGGGKVLVGEVSSTNDDQTDNRFHEPIGRFPEIEEDVPPTHLLAWEYPPAAG